MRDPPYTGPLMDRNLRALLVALGVLMVAWAAYRSRPVRPPEMAGRWEPVEP